jgi:hypothetical protein
MTLELFIIILMTFIISLDSDSFIGTLTTMSILFTIVTLFVTL